MEQNEEKTPKTRSKHRIIELPEKFSGWRLVLAIVCLLIGVGALGYGINALISRPAGWTEIKVRDGAAENCAADFTFRCRLGKNAKKTERELTAVYTQAAERCQALFSAEQAAPGMGNLAAVNQSPNRAVTVEPELYDALKQAAEAGGRRLYLAPVYACYEGLLRAADEQEALEYDPYRNPEIADYIEALLPFVNDPSAAELELLGDARVCLHVSDDYLRFAQENEIGAFIDFYWMKNAFIIDIFAQELTQYGFTDGVLTSVDGFFRRLDRSGASFSTDLAVREGNALRQIATLDYTCPLAAMLFRDYPLRDDLGDYYYTTGDGQIRTAYVDPRDGRCKSALHEALCFSDTQGCAAIALHTAPLLIADAPDESALDALAQQQIYVLWQRQGAAYVSATPDGVSLRTE